VPIRISLFTVRCGEAAGGRDKERGRSKPLSTVESGERRKKKLKANNGANDDAECRGGSGGKSNKKAYRILFLSYPGNLAPSTAVMKLRFASAEGGARLVPEDAIIPTKRIGRI
jgi:hypothetical protein